MTLQLVRFADSLVRADSGGRTVHGLAVPFNVAADVDDGFGPYREMFAPGAFTRSIQERGAKVKLFGQHDTGRFPLGKATSLEERADGLHVAFQVAATRDGDEALELVSSGVVDGFSIGFAPRRERTDPDGTVIRTEVALREVSLVHSPAYADALVSGVRSAHSPLSTEIAAMRLTLLLETW